ncbi:predicted GPI-anchored protein 58 [Phragmites australis]|uniref:predicted GPI-anchored protein 58 n=1 Tax=Phragmites australis TaxID=29695 RepID=UPI002D7804D2|nr:predicted GPI-anchored protein 58 [Phragmites australis]
MGPDPAPGDLAVAPPSPRWKRMREDSGPELSGPEFRIPAAKWQYRGTKTAPPAGAAEGQGRPEAPRPAPVPELSAPAEPGLASAAAGPRPVDTATETGQTDGAAVPELADAVAEPEPVDAMSLPGPADAVAERVPADAAAETETQPRQSVPRHPTLPRACRARGG